MDKTKGELLQEELMMKPVNLWLQLQMLLLKPKKAKKV